MKTPKLSRRELLVGGSATVASLAMLNSRMAFAAPLKQGEEVLPWIDQPGDNPVPDIVTNMLDWEGLDSWVTPPENFFSVRHYNQPEIAVDDWQLEIKGLVENPMTLTMSDLQAWPEMSLDFTLECAGNHGFGWNWGLLGQCAVGRYCLGTATARSRYYG